jgi:hypothetical protein
LDKKGLQTILLVGLILAGSIVIVFYSHKYNELYTFVPLLSLLLSYAYLYSIWVKPDNSASKFLSNLRSIGAGLIFIFFVYVVFNLETRYKKNELERYGVTVKGQVIDIEKSGFRTTHYDAIFVYSLNKVTYTQGVNNDEHLFQTMDSLTIRCSSRDPELCKVIAYRRKQN